MPLMTRQQLTFGAIIAGITAVVGVLSALLTLYSQASPIVESFVAQRIRQDFAPVGTVVASMLPPVKFAEATGEKEGQDYRKRKWILADGRAVNGTEYAILTSDKPIPDLRGMFTRGVAGAGQAGDFQEYATALPRTKHFTGKTSTAGSHQHDLGATPSGVGDRYNAGGRDYLVMGSTKTAAGGDHSHSVDIDGGGDDETRPRNVAVYYYIKIN